MKKLILCALSACLALSAHAATIEWNNTGTDYATGSDWVGGVAPANSTTADIAAFGSTGASAMNPNLAAARSVGGVSFLSGAFSYTFSGAILTVGNSGISDSAANVETFSNTIRPSINQTWTSAGGASLILNGIVDINGTTGAARFLTLAGAGAFTFNGVIQNSFAASTGNLTYNGTGSLTLTNTNTYTGNTVISNGSVLASKDGALGGGNVSLTGGAVVLTLQGGASNNYIADTRNLSIITGSGTVLLNYSGSDTINGLIINSQALAPGVYGAIGSGAANENAAFSGSGFLTVTTLVPEPSTYILLGLGVLICAQQFCRKKAS